MARGTILFDLDGTLVDSAGDLDTLMAEKGLPPSGLETGRMLMGHGIANLVRSALKLHGAARQPLPILSGDAQRRGM
jgi:phosphoglycolate phosphatase-like HAD superfamily hydrolase